MVFDFSSKAQMDHIAGERLEILISQQAERRHRRPFNAFAECADDIFAPRFPPSLFLAGRGEFENALPIITRVGIDPGSRGAAAIAAQAVTVQALLPVHRAAFFQRFFIQLEGLLELPYLGRGMSRAAKNLDEFAVQFPTLVLAYIGDVQQHVLALLLRQTDKKLFRKLTRQVVGRRILLRLLHRQRIAPHRIFKIVRIAIKLTARENRQSKQKGNDHCERPRRPVHRPACLHARFLLRVQYHVESGNLPGMGMVRLE